MKSALKKSTRSVRSPTLRNVVRSREVIQSRSSSSNFALSMFTTSRNNSFSMSIVRRPLSLRAQPPQPPNTPSASGPVRSLVGTAQAEAGPKLTFSSRSAFYSRSHSVFEKRNLKLSAPSPSIYQFHTQKTLNQRSSGNKSFNSTMASSSSSSFFFPSLSSPASFSSPISFPGSSRRFCSLFNASLTHEQRAVVDEEIRVLNDFKKLINSVSPTAEDVERLDRAIKQIEELFLLVVVGEFNSGKSTFLNALMGKKYLTEGVTPTTSRVGLLKYGKTHDVRSLSEDMELISLPVDWLKDVNMVDTPGTNAVIQAHQRITEDFVPRSDLVMFVTSSDRPFTETERQFLTKIRQWGKKIIVIISKADILERPEDLQTVTDFVKEHFQKVTGYEPEVFPVVAKQALLAKIEHQPGTPELLNSKEWQKSRFEPLEKYIMQTLDPLTRAKLKLLNPIGVANHLSDKYFESLTTRKKILQSDLKTLKNIDQQIEEYQIDLKKDFELQKERIDNTLLKMEKRGTEFFENKVSLSNIMDLIRPSQVRNDFEHSVVGETSRVIERQMGDIVDWMLSKNSRLWTDVMTYTKGSASLQTNEIMGPINTVFEYNRQELINGIARESVSVVEAFDPKKEAAVFVDQVRNALLATVAVEGSVGLGTLIGLTLMDVSGFIGVGVVAALGLGILPIRRAQLKAAFGEKVNGLRTTLKDTVESHFERELQKSVDKIENAIEPYSRFVRAEERAVELLQRDLGTIKDDLDKLHDKISQAFPSVKD